MPKQDFIVDADFNGNKFINTGEASVSPSAIITPPVIVGASVNDYNPTGLEDASFLRISNSTINANITGLTAPNPLRNKILTIYNVGTLNVVLTNNSASSSANNRFLIGVGNFTIRANGGVSLFYDVLVSRWRVNKE